MELKETADTTVSKETTPETKKPGSEGQNDNSAMNQQIVTVPTAISNGVVHHNNAGNSNKNHDFVGTHNAMPPTQSGPCVGIPHRLSIDSNTILANVAAGPGTPTNHGSPTNHGGAQNTTTVLAPNATIVLQHHNHYHGNSSDFHSSPQPLSPGMVQAGSKDVAFNSPGSGSSSERRHSTGSDGEFELQPTRKLSTTSQ